jgi:serine/threonine protein kinase
VASPADVRAGQVLGGRYHLGELLGRGGSASVYAAHDAQLDRDVAVKIWDRPDEAKAEGRLTARLRHPGVVVVHDGDAEGDTAYLVMERIAGLSLDVELGMGPLTVERTARIGAQLARTLSLVHADGIVHGDVKPGNILLGPDDHATLSDFGVAGPTQTRRRDLTHRTVTQGTPPYLSPEQVRGRRITPATDVYALGLVLLECLTGVRAFPGTPEASALARLERGPRVPSTVPADLGRLVRDMTEPDPVRRPTAGQVAARLETRTSRADTLLLATGPATQPLSTESKPWWLFVGVALLAATAALAMTGPEQRGSQGGVPAQAPTPTATAPAPQDTPTAAPSRPAPAVAPARGPAKGHGHRKHR